MTDDLIFSGIHVYRAGRIVATFGGCESGLTLQQTRTLVAEVGAAWKRAADLETALQSAAADLLASAEPFDRACTTIRKILDRPATPPALNLFMDSTGD